MVGQAVSGPGIPVGTTITAISNTLNAITLSSAATTTAGNVALSYTVASGVRNVAVEGDVLTSVTATAQAFISLPSTAGGISLPSDALAGVGVRDFLPNSSIQAASIQAVSFGSHSEENGQIYTGAASQGEDAQDMLAAGTQMVQANDTFRAPFADQTTQQAQLFFVTDPHGGHFETTTASFWRSRPLSRPRTRPIPQARQHDHAEQRGPGCGHRAEDQRDPDLRQERPSTELGL